MVRGSKKPVSEARLGAGGVGYAKGKLGYIGVSVIGRGV
jgi:hypothetical protein